MGQKPEPVALALVRRSYADGSKSQDGYAAAVISDDPGTGEHHVAHDYSVSLHYEIQFGYEVGVVSVEMQYVMFGAAGTVYVPECLSGKAFHLTVVRFTLKAYDSIMIHF